MSRYRLERSEEQIREFIGFCLSHKDTKSLTAVLRVWRDEHPQGILSPFPQVVFFAMIGIAYMSFMMGKSPATLRFTLIMFVGIGIYAFIRWRKTAPNSDDYVSPYADRLKSTLRLLIADNQVELGRLDENDVKLLATIFQHERLPERLYLLLEQKSLLPTS